MRIEGPSTPKRATPAKKTKSAGASKSSSLKSMGSADQVQLNDHVSTLDEIRELVSQQADIRMDEVDRIVRELKGKRYKIDFEKVAEGFLKEAILTEIARKPKKR